MRPTAISTGKELPILFSLPRNSLKGVVVDKCADFGRDVFNPNEFSDVIVVKGNSTFRVITINNKDIKEKDGSNKGKIAVMKEIVKQHYISLEELEAANPSMANEDGGAYYEVRRISLIMCRRY